MKTIKFLIIASALSVMLSSCGKNDDNSITNQPSASPSASSNTDMSDNNNTVTDDIGNAAKDITDGAGNAVKGAVDGIENAVGSVTGNR